MLSTSRWSKSAWLCSLLVAVGCHGSPQSPKNAAIQSTKLVVRHARRLNNELITLVAENGTITQVLADDAVVEGEADATKLDLAGRWIVPAYIDSHVHAAYLATISRFPDRGIAAVVDLGKPLSTMAVTYNGLQMLTAGPLMTAPGGYPTQSWGRDGYGLEVAGPGDADAAVAKVVDAGATVVKLAFADAPSLDEPTARALVEAAHARGLKVAAHALTDTHAALAARVGCDVLAHTPVEPLSEATIAAWSGRAVISTLSAFGAGGAALANLQALHKAGATVMYGTDFGNSTYAGITNAETFAMIRAGFELPQIVDMATKIPAAYWGFTDLGELAVGKRASFFATADPPTERPDTLAVPIRVFIDGVERRP